MSAGIGELIIGGLIASGVGAGAAEGVTAASITIAGVNISATTVGSAALFAASTGLNLALAAGAPKQPKPANGLISIRQPNPVRQGGYGRDRVAMAYMLYETVPPVGTQSLDVLAAVSGRICGWKQFYLNDDQVSLAGTTVNTQPDGRYAGAAVALEWRVGLPVETAYSASIVSLPALWTTDHRGDGIASLQMSCLQAANLNDFTKVFPNGLPNPSAACNLFAIWDPRDAGQNPDDPLTWTAYAIWNVATTYAAGARVIRPSLSCAPAYNAGTTYAKYARASSGGVDYFSRVAGNVGNAVSSLASWLPIGAPYYSYAAGNVGNDPDTSPSKWCSVLSNQILQLIDYWTSADHGMGLDRSMVTPVMANLIAKANACDALVADKDGNIGPRYTSNGKFNFDEDPADVQAAIAATCDGWFAEDGEGSIAVEVGQYVAPTITLDHARGHLLAGPFSVNYGVNGEQAINELTITYTDPAQKYQEVPGLSWRNEEDISARGVVRTQPLALPWVQRHSQARRLAKRAMARVSAKHGTLTASLYGLRALGQRWVNIAYPFLPGMGTSAAPVVVELSRGTIDFATGTVAFDWVLVDPATIDAYDAATEEDPPAAAMFTAISPDITVSNGGLTVTKNANQDVGSTVLFGSTNGHAKVYAEVLMTVDPVHGDQMVGIAPPSHPIASELGSTAGSWGWYGTSQLWNNNVGLGFVPPAYVAGQWLGIALDRTAKTLQLRNITAGGAWSATTSVAAAGTSNFCLGCSMFDVTASYTFNFNGAFLGAPPAAGYTRWDGSTL